MGADTLAASVMYMIAFYHGYWRGAACFIAFDFMIYGPQILAAPISAATTAFAFL